MRVICPLLKAWKLRPKRPFGFHLWQLVYQMENVSKKIVLELTQLQNS